MLRGAGSWEEQLGRPESAPEGVRRQRRLQRLVRPLLQKTVGSPDLEGWSPGLGGVSSQGASCLSELGGLWEQVDERRLQGRHAEPSV